MKLLLVGPYPPPHGGVSVHLVNMQRQARRDGIPCRILNTQRFADPSPEYIPVNRAGGFFYNLVFHALRGWTIHVHTNGHNAKSWLVALASGCAGRLGPGSRLTLHSGGLPDYLGGATPRRWLARLTCRFFDRIVCVSSRLSQSLEQLGVPGPLLEVAPAFQGVSSDEARWVVSPKMEKWFARHSCIVSATVSDRPEYGVSLILQVIENLASQRKDVGCLLLGVDNSVVEIREEIERRNLSQSVLLLGDVPHGECLYLISRSKVFVRATLIDGDSISVREALALGVPVVASDAATRPDGTIRFKTGNAEDLAMKLKCVFEESLQNSAP